jgi:hypothetical protein
MIETEPASQSIMVNLLSCLHCNAPLKKWWIHLRVIKPPIKVVKCTLLHVDEDNLPLRLLRGNYNV